MRRLLKPQAKRLKQLENRIEKLSRRKRDLESQLAQPSIYQQAQKELLNTTLFEQAEIARDLQQQEDDWLVLSEEIETIRG